MSMPCLSRNRWLFRDRKGRSQPIGRNQNRGGVASQPPQDRHHELEEVEVKRQPNDLVSVELS